MTFEDQGLLGPDNVVPGDAKLIGEIARGGKPRPARNAALADRLADLRHELVGQRLASGVVQKDQKLHWRGPRVTFRCQPQCKGRATASCLPMGPVSVD